MLLLRPKTAALSALLLSASASPTPQHDQETRSWTRFSALLDTVDERALHLVLHAAYPKFKDGIFSRDRTAVEQVHSENPSMASKLVYIARRQTNNDTVLATTTSTTSTQIEVSTTLPPVTSEPSSTTPVQTSMPESSSSYEQSVSSVIDSALSSLITATTVPPPTTVLVNPPPPASATPILTESGLIVYTTEGGGVLTLTASPVDVSFSQSTSTRLYYTTLPNGERHTITSVVVVNAPVTQTSGPTSVAGEPTNAPGLQGDAAKTAVGAWTGIMLGALGLWAAL